MISIILPTFNRSQLLCNTIDSVLKQTFEEYELIIINDHSSDHTKQVIVQYQLQDKRIKYIENQKNLGCAESRVVGIDNSKGKFLVFLDDDDIWKKDKLMKQYNTLVHTNSDMVISDYQINKNNRLIYKTMEKFSKNFKEEILKRPGPFFQSIMIKKNIIDQLNQPFDNKAIPSEDWNFFIELSKINLTVSYVPEPLFIWNIHKNNQSLNLQKEAEALLYILKKHYHYIQSIHNNSVISDHYKRVARLYEKNYDNKKITQIKKLYIKAFKINPLSIKNMFYFIVVMLGYHNTRHIIGWIRKIRGIENV